MRRTLGDDGIGEQERYIQIQTRQVLGWENGKVKGKNF